MQTATAQPIPVGLIGCGTVAQYGHLPTIDANPALYLAAIADPNETTALATAEKFRAASYTNYHDLLARPDIVAVTVSTPLALHYEITAAALKAGKHVFCEKPFTTTPEQADELVALAEEHGRLLAINFEYRLDESIPLIQSLLGSGELGQLQVMRFVNNWSAHGTQGKAGERRRRFMEYGGGCLDCGVHFIDLARFFAASNFQSLTAHGQWAEPELAGPGHMLITARTETGVLAHLESSFIYTHNSQTKRSVLEFELIGDRGVFSWTALPHNPQDPDAELAEIRINTATRTETRTISSAKQFSTAYKLWAKALGQGSLEGTNLASGEDGRQATHLMAEALKLAESKRPARRTQCNTSSSSNSPSPISPTSSP